MVNGLGERLALHLVHLPARADVVFIGGQVARLCRQDLLLVGGAEADRQTLEDGGYDAVLHVKEVVPPAVDFLSRERIAGRGVDDVGGYADAVADPLVAAADDPSCAEIVADIDGCGGIVLRAAEATQALHHAAAAGDADGLDLREIGGEAFRDACAEPVEIGSAADILEIDYGENRRRRGRRAGRSRSPYGPGSEGRRRLPPHLCSGPRARATCIARSMTATRGGMRGLRVLHAG